MSADRDWDLVARARSGQVNAFEELVRRYQNPVISFCQRMVGSRQDAEDIAQESFVRLYQSLRRLRPDAQFSTLLFQIARNLTLNFLRDSRRRGRGTTQSLQWEDGTERPIEGRSERPDRAMRLRELEAVIEESIDRLPPKHREVLLLREMQNLGYEAIARILKCRIGTVRSRLARARQQLRLDLQRSGGDVL